MNEFRLFWVKFGPVCFRPLDVFLVGLFEVLVVPLNASALYEDIDVVHEAY